MRDAPALGDLPQRNAMRSNAAFVAQCIARLDAGRPPCDPRSAAEMADLLFRLFTAGRHDIPLGRLFEGHVDALQILHRYGGAQERRQVATGAEGPPILGVWNAEGPAHRLSARVGHGEGHVSGGKSYASGAGILTHALVTSEAGTARVQLWLVDLGRAPPEIDRDWWHVAGMQQSWTHRVTWRAAPATAIGGPGDYEREPWFSGGALRFAAVQAGGLAGLLDAVRAHLAALGRAEDPVQQRRLAELYGAAHGAACTVRAAGLAGFERDAGAQGAAVANARNVVYAACETGIALAQRACGTAAYFEGHPVCRFAQDLGMYIRQPGPDAQLARVGAAVAAEGLDVWPCGI